MKEGKRKGSEASFWRAGGRCDRQNKHGMWHTMNKKEGVLRIGLCGWKVLIKGIVTSDTDWSYQMHRCSVPWRCSARCSRETLVQVSVPDPPVKPECPSDPDECFLG